MMLIALFSPVIPPLHHQRHCECLLHPHELEWLLVTIKPHFFELGLLQQELNLDSFYYCKT